MPHEQYGCRLRFWPLIVRWVANLSSLFIGMSLASNANASNLVDDFPSTWIIVHHIAFHLVFLSNHFAINCFLTSLHCQAHTCHMNNMVAGCDFDLSLYVRDAAINRNKRLIEITFHHRSSKFLLPNSMKIRWIFMVFHDKLNRFWGSFLEQKCQNSKLKTYNDLKCQLTESFKNR